jgi:hypothetical protein
MHLLHANQQASSSAHRILRILTADLRDRKKMYMMGVESVHLAQDRDRGRVHANTLMNIWIPSDPRNLLTTGRSINFSRRTLLQEVILYDVTS